MALYASLVLVDTRTRLACARLLALPGVCNRPWSLRGSRGMAMADGRWCAVCAFPVHQTWSLQSLYSNRPWSCRPQPLGSGGDATPCEDPRQEHGPHFKCVAGCLSMVPHMLCSSAAGATCQLLPVGRERCRVVHDMCKASTEDEHMLNAGSQRVPSP